MALLRDATPQLYSPGTPNVQPNLILDVTGSGFVIAVTVPTVQVMFNIEIDGIMVNPTAIALAGTIPCLFRFNTSLRFYSQFANNSARVVYVLD